MAVTNTNATHATTFIDPRTVMRIKNLQLRARVVVEGFYAGIHRSPYHGFSVEFSEYRAYTPGDDPRYLDWRLFARSDRYCIKRFEDETNLLCYLVVDMSRSMSFGSAEYPKSEYARTLAASLAYFLFTQRDAVGLLTFDEEVADYLPPRHRAGHLRRLYGMLDRETAGRSTDLSRPLERIAESVRKRGLVVLISDLLTPAAEVRTRLGYLRSRGHDILVLQVLDPAEVEFTFTAPLMFNDLETGRRLYIDPQAARTDYQRRFHEHSVELKQACTDLGVDFARLTTDQPLELALFDLLNLRERRGKRISAPRRLNTEGERMSMLTPLYALGLLAVSLPIIFHLIRRQPRGQFEFSSLMFLSPSPPRIAKRSKLDHLLLLLLRGLALSLLAFAFARPFLRSEEPTAPADADAARVAIVVDTSASMRRGDLWKQATAAVDGAMADVRPSDQIAIFACDDSLRPLVSFEDMSKVAPRERRAVVAARLQDVKPTWAATHLGQGLMDAVEIVNNVAEARDQHQPLARRIVLVSDMQEGSRLTALADYPWPEDVALDLRPVTSSQKTNAGLHYVADTDGSESAASKRDIRVRVSNDADSIADEFQFAWIDQANKPIGDSTPTYVPAGESRIVRVPRPAQGAAATRLRLTGDNHDFDNTIYLAARPSAATSVLYIGDERADDAKGLRYYLERALIEGASTAVTIATATADKSLPLESPTATPLAVITAEPTADQIAQLRDYTAAGGTVLVVLRESKDAAALAKLVGIPSLEADEAKLSNYAMLSEIDFGHPLFASMAGPHFNDFTQIHFWKYRRLKADQLKDAELVARFENGDPALVEWTIGKGRVFVLTSGWQPSDSQFARSWKFVLFVSALLNESQPGQTTRAYFTINESVPLGERDESEAPISITNPLGAVVKLDPSARTFDATDAPGIYTLTAGDNSQAFAVNFDPLESKTAAVGSETLEQWGCRLVKPTALADATRHRQQIQDSQLESRQKWWQWLIVGALGILVAETWLAGRAARPALAEGSPA